jgi:phenylpyruvate tautomerase PptA (4-oxalocrotonate tautomerase family)
MSKGRTLEQKRLLVKDVTEVVAKDLRVPPQSVAIELEEFAPENMAQSEASH